MLEGCFIKNWQNAFLNNRTHFASLKRKSLFFIKLNLRDQFYMYALRSITCITIMNVVLKTNAVYKMIKYRCKEKEIDIYEL